MKITSKSHDEPEPNRLLLPISTLPTRPTLFATCQVLRTSQGRYQALQVGFKRFFVMYTQPDCENGVFHLAFYDSSMPNALAYKPFEDEGSILRRPGAGQAQTACMADSYLYYMIQTSSISNRIAISLQARLLNLMMIPLSIHWECHTMDPFWNI